MRSRLVAVLLVLVACTPHEDPKPRERSAPELEIAAPTLDGVTMIAPGLHHTCALRESRVLCWGLNRNDMLGVGPGLPEIVTVAHPVVGLDEPIVQIAADYDFSCALGESGALYCWGDNGHGQLGVGDLERRTRPTRVGDLRASAVALGFRHACAVAHDRSTAWCWGSGEFGDGRLRQFESTPIKVQALAGVDQLVSNGEHACWRRGTEVRCWGSNDLGQIGNGESGCVDGEWECDCRLTAVGCKRVDDPTEPLGLSGTAQIAIAGKRSHALEHAGVVWQWGGGVDRPQRITELPLIARITAGFQHVYALDVDGGIWYWGDDSSGQLELEGRDEHPSPRRVEGLPPARAVAAHYVVTCALTGADGRAWCWGDNLFGQLGDGSTEEYRHTPVPVRAAVHGL